MIVCVSTNPALDRRLRVGQLSLGEVNRANSSEILPGGKAAHVAMAARALGEKVAWVAFLGGAIGEQCATELRQLDIEVVPIATKSATRVNVEVIEDSTRITELLEPGGTADPNEQAEMLRVCEQRLRSDWGGALVAISGSLPAGVRADFYSSIIQIAHSAGSKVFLDTSGDALPSGLETKPEFVKPNRKEAEALFGRSVKTLAEAQSAASDLIARGAQSAAVTLGAEGLVWKENANGPVWMASPPRLQAVSTVGCGDVTLAGFAIASQQKWTGEQALRFATACGAANCLAKLEGRIRREDIEAMLPRILISQL